MENNQAIGNKGPVGARAGWKNLIKAVAFMLIFCVLLMLLQNVIVPNRDLPTETVRLRKNIHGLLNEPENSIDVIWLGSSHVHHGISPMEIYRESNVRSYLIAGNSQRIPVAYYMLKEALKRQSPKLVAVDVGSLFFNNSRNRNKDRWQENIDALPLSAISTRVEMAKKLAELNEEAFDENYVYRSVLPVLQYHTNYALTEDEFYDLHLDQLYEQKGYVISDAVKAASADSAEIIHSQLYPSEGGEAPADAEPVDDALLKEVENMAYCLEVNREYIEQMKQLCGEHGSELMLIKVPVYRTREEYEGYWSLQKHELVQQLADELGLEFLDLNYEDVGLDWQTDTRDGGKHLNMLGAKKLSRFLGDWLKANRDFDESASGQLQASWNAQLELYDWKAERYGLRVEKNVLNWFDKLSRGDYTLLATMSGDVSGFWTDGLQAAFTSLTGCEQDLREIDGGSIALASRGGSVLGFKVEEAVAEEIPTIEDAEASESDADEDRDEDEAEEPEQDEGESGASEDSDEAEAQEEEIIEVDPPLSGDLPGGKTYAIKNGMIRLSDKRVSSSAVGLQIVVYDNALGCVLDNVTLIPGDQSEEGAGEAEVTLKRANKAYSNTFYVKAAEYIYKAMGSI